MSMEAEEFPQLEAATKQNTEETEETYKSYNM
jgi:hypothetical protein